MKFIAENLYRTATVLVPATNNQTICKCFLYTLLLLLLSKFLFFSNLQKKETTVPDLSLENCRLSNISECALTSEKDAFLVTIYNPLSRPVDYFVRLPVQNTSYTVLDPNGDQVLTQVHQFHQRKAKDRKRDLIYSNFLDNINLRA